MYLINIYTKWLKQWEANNWKKMDGKEIENLNLIKEIHDLILDCKLKIFYKHVKAHREKPSDEKSDEYLIWFGNNKADELATYSANIVKEKYLENKKK